MSFPLNRSICLCWSVILICGLTGIACHSQAKLPMDEAELVQRLVQKAIGGLQAGNLDILKECGWQIGLSEAQRIHSDPKARNEDGLYKKLIENENVPYKLIIRPGHMDQCVVLARPYAEASKTKANSSIPYAFLVQKKDGSWRIQDSRFVPQALSDESNPESAFKVFNK